MASGEFALLADSAIPAATEAEAFFQGESSFTHPGGLANSRRAGGGKAPCRRQTLLQDFHWTGSEDPSPFSSGIFCIDLKCVNSSPGPSTSRPYCWGLELNTRCCVCPRYANNLSGGLNAGRRFPDFIRTSCLLVSLQNARQMYGARNFYKHAWTLSDTSP